MKAGSLIIIDVDGTVSCNENRWKAFGDGKDKEKFHSLEECLKDPPKHDVINMLKAMKYANLSNVFFIVLTARKETDRKVTEEYFKFHKIPYDEIVMMPNDQDISAEDFKLGKCKEYLDKNWNIWFVLEDNPKVVKTLRENGITVFHVADCTYA